MAFILMALPVASRAVAFSASQTPAVTLNQSVYSLTFDSQGNLWVSDGPANEILEYAAPVTSASTPVLTLHLSFSPNGIAFDPSGNLLVSSFQQSTLSVIKAPITSSSTASLVASLYEPNQMTFGPNGYLWVTSSSTSNQLLEMPSPATSPAVKTRITVGTAGATDVAFDSSGDLWVSDYSTNSVMEISASSVTACSGILNCAPTVAKTLGVTTPNSLAFDSSGNLWVASGGSGASVVEFSPPYTTPTLTLTKGLGTDVTAVRTDQNGNVWVADRGTSQILEFLAPLPPVSVGLPIPQSATPPLLKLATYGGATVDGSLVGLIGDTQVEYNVPSINQTLLGLELAQGNFTQVPDTVSVCSTQVGGQDYIRVAGFFGGSWGGTLTNSTEFIFSDYQSFLTSATGWPAEPACSG